MEAEKKAAILIVDDDAHIRESLLDNLEAAGHEVCQASSEKEALKEVHARFFDVIIMDYNLPDSTGIDVVKKIRETNTDSEILMLTAHASLDTAVMAIRESIADFLSKPVDMDHLKHAISKAIEKSRLLKENKRFSLELKKTNGELAHLNDMKSKFLSMSSHDLSNALMALQASFELLSQTMNPSDEQKKRMASIAASISQLTRLTADLVDWASIEKGKFRIEPEKFNPEVIFQEILAGSEARAAARGILFSSRIAGPLPLVFADKRRIAQVLNNLLENAIRYVPRGGKVGVSMDKVSMTDGGCGIRVGVKDSGEGIAPSETPKIFQSFYQGPDASKSGRMGLGLATSKEIVEAHGGTIWVESPGLGHGATFFFTLPAADH